MHPHGQGDRSNDAAADNNALGTGSQASNEAQGLLKEGHIHNFLHKAAEVVKDATQLVASPLNYESMQRTANIGAANMAQERFNLGNAIRTVGTLANVVQDIRHGNAYGAASQYANMNRQIAWNQNPMQQPAWNQNPQQQPVWNQNPMQQQPAWNQNPMQQQPVWNQNPMQQQPAWNQNPMQQQPAWNQNPQQQPAWNQNPMQQPAWNQNPMQQPAWNQNPMQQPAWNQNPQQQNPWVAARNMNLNPARDFDTEVETVVALETAATRGGLRNTINVALSGGAANVDVVAPIMQQMGFGSLDQFAHNPSEQAALDANPVARLGFHRAAALTIIDKMGDNPHAMADVNAWLGKPFNDAQIQQLSQMPPEQSKRIVYEQLQDKLRNLSTGQLASCAASMERY